jgi:hypothetical protein
MWIAIFMLLSGCGDITRTASYAPASPVPVVNVEGVTPGRFKAQVTGATTATLEGAAIFETSPRGIRILMPMPDLNGKVVVLQMPPGSQAGTYPMKKETIAEQEGIFLDVYGAYFEPGPGERTSYTIIQGGTLLVSSMDETYTASFDFSTALVDGVTIVRVTGIVNQARAR